MRAGFARSSLMLQVSSNKVSVSRRTLSERSIAARRLFRSTTTTTTTTTATAAKRKTSTSALGSNSDDAVAPLKAALLSAVQGTARGGSATTSQRGAVEEAVASLEAAFEKERQLDEERFYAENDGNDDEEDKRNDPLRFLAGRWRLIYTTALDVAPLLAASDAVENGVLARVGVPVGGLGEIYQVFGEPASLTVSSSSSSSSPSSSPTSSSSDSSSSRFSPVKNVIDFRLPPLLDSLTATVSARYEVKSSRPRSLRLSLVFDRAALGKVRLSPLAEALLAPAILPRGDVQRRILMLLREAEVGVPLSAQGLDGGGASSSSSSASAKAALLPLLRPARALVDRAVGAARSAAGSEYLLSFLDEDTLIGRQTGPGGLFVFQRAADDE